MRAAAPFIASQSSHSPAGLLPTLLDDLVVVLRGWKNRRQVLELSQLDDHLLADIGLARKDVDWALHQPFAYDLTLALQGLAIQKRGRGWRSE